MEKNKIYQAAWRREERKKNPEKVRAKARLRYAKKKEIILKQVKKYQDNNKDKIKVRKKAKYYSHSPEVRKDNALKTNYGISLRDYQEMYLRNNGQCWICNSFQPVLHVDHCHDTKKVRGVLCQKCNQGIGLFNENIETMNAAIEYLGKSKVKKKA